MEYKFEYMPIRHVAKLLNVSPLEVRRLCKEGEIAANHNGRSRWEIPTDQFRNHPNWKPFLNDFQTKLENSKKVAELALEMWEDDEGDEKAIERPVLVNRGVDLLLITKEGSMDVANMSPVKVIELLNKKGLADIQIVHYSEYEKSNQYPKV